MKSRRMQKHGISLAASGFCQLLAAILLCPALALPSAVQTSSVLHNSGTEGTAPNLLTPGVKAKSCGTPLDAFNDPPERVPNGRGLVF